MPTEENALSQVIRIKRVAVHYHDKTLYQQSRSMVIYTQAFMMPKDRYHFTARGLNSVCSLFFATVTLSDLRSPVSDSKNSELTRLVNQKVRLGI